MSRTPSRQILLATTDLLAGAGPTAIDLFAGAGGATQGLKTAGYQVLAAVELDADAAATYARNHSDVKLLAKDIRLVDPVELADGVGLGPAALTILKACPPCQGFSTLGPNASDDPRNDLTLEVWRFVRALRPLAFVIENVPGIRSDRRLARVMRQARAISYRVRSYDVDATEFGVAQYRCRHIVVGLRNLLAPFPAQISDLLPKRVRSRPPTAGEVLSQVSRSRRHADPLNRWRASRPLTLERIRAVPVGGSRFDLPTALQLPCHRRLGTRVATGSYGRLRIDEPSPTLTTRCTTPSCGPFIHPTEDRGLTLREAAALQTFPLSYDFIGGYDSIERQIGNAVPVLMASGLGHAVRHLLGGEVRCGH